MTSNRNDARLRNLVARLSDWQDGEGDAGDTAAIYLEAGSLSMALKENGDVTIRFIPGPIS